jgi:hypothetical protein
MINSRAAVREVCAVGDPKKIAINRTDRVRENSEPRPKTAMGCHLLPFSAAKPARSLQPFVRWMGRETG